jgi:hypothetical protein
MPYTKGFYCFLVSTMAILKMRIAAIQKGGGAQQSVNKKAL